MIRLAVATAVLLAACGAVPGVETAHQSYWYCWNREVLLPDRPHRQSIDADARRSEHLCTDPELKDKGCTRIPSPPPGDVPTAILLSGWLCLPP